jgi:O-succinylbenzoic acid--CoA ligase
VLARARALLVGGAACPPELLAESAARGVRALATYGMTEMCSQVATQPYLPGAVIAQRGVGRPLPGVELRLVGDDGAPVAAGEVGRITVRGPMRMLGYWRHHALAEAEWFDTGDLGSLDEDGVLSIHARRTDLIVTGGENVYPVEVEQCLESHPSVAAALVFGLPDPVWGQRVAAAVVARGEVADEAAWCEALWRHLSGRLAGYKRPRLLARVEAIAALPSGKPDRAGAAARYGASVRPWGEGVSSRA